MEISTTSDEGDPAPGVSFSRAIIIYLSFFVLLLFSCTQKNKEVKQLTPGKDSTAIKQTPKKGTDTLPTTKLAGPKKKIYLTFDDGPNNGTMNVLTAVKEENIPVSFFIVGKHVFDSPEQLATWQQLKADSAIELCNHSYTHALNHYTKYYLHPGAVVKDIERNKEKLGFDNLVVRMPGRNAWRIGLINRTDIKESKLAIDSVHAAGFAIIGWDVEWMFDHKTLALITDPDLLLRQIENRLASDKTRTPGHLVLLAHDQAFQRDADKEKLNYFLRELKKNPDYEFVLAGSYPGIKE